MTDPRYEPAVQLDSIEIIDGNPNHMDPDQYQRLKTVIEKVGFLQPILLRENPDPDAAPFVLVDGEHRLQIFNELGRESIPAMVVDAQADLGEALRIGMNRLRGELSLTAVANTCGELLDDGWSFEDLVVTGFGEPELSGLLDAVRTNPLDTAMMSPEPLTETSKPQGYSLSIRFETEADKTRVKAALLDAADGGNIAEGILALISS